MPNQNHFRRKYSREIISLFLKNFFTRIPSSQKLFMPCGTQSETIHVLWQPIRNYLCFVAPNQNCLYLFVSCGTQSETIYALWHPIRNYVYLVVAGQNYLCLVVTGQNYLCLVVAGQNYLCLVVAGQNYLCLVAVIIDVTSYSVKTIPLKFLFT